ncbi:DUF2267 domain-containing protein [Streptomyces sp. SID14478]|uniref:DUF2267 domain-containing protein n=1 Tax=Streptomyces sp. SID14478 TaxID=2706073 RepID=UPI0031BB3586
MHAPSDAYTNLLEQIRYQGAYATLEQAERVAVTVLAALGEQLTGAERAEVGRQLPTEAARCLAQAAPSGTSVTAHAFVKNLAASTDAPYATTRWDVGSVLVSLARTLPPQLLDRILAQLPAGYALLFGKADLTVNSRHLHAADVAVAA